MKTVFEIFYDAIVADSTLHELTGGRVKSTCFETPPEQEDNTPLPNIIIVGGKGQNSASNKDVVWETDEDIVEVVVSVAGNTDGQVAQLTSLVRQAIEEYVTTMYLNQQEIPTLEPGYPVMDEISWDWMKPCFFQNIRYRCTYTKYIYGKDNETKE